MTAGDLYREIDTHEFRGEGFFYATYIVEDQWVDAVPPDWKVKYYLNDEVILEKLDDEWYRVCAVNAHRDGRWGVPLHPMYDNTHYYRMHKDWLGDIRPRLVGGE